MNSNLPKLALVVPCYNEEACIEASFEALKNKFKEMMESSLISRESFLCFVDDGSRDRTFELLSTLVANESGGGVSACVVKLAKNAGHQNALIAGLDYVKEKCDCSISIDADLQDDVGVLGEFVAKFNEGCEVVFGVRNSRKTDTFFKRSTAQGFYKFMELLGVKVVYNHADFRLLSRRATQNLLEFKERNLFLRALATQLGLKTANVFYSRAERIAGESKYPLKKMLDFAWDGITSFSISPLRLLSVLGFCFFLLSVLLGGWVIGVKLFSEEAVRGWATTATLTTFFGGIQLLSLGVIGEYIGKIYKEVKGRPRFFVEKVVESGSESGSKRE